jgi:hypothetical protein
VYVAMTGNDSAMRTKKVRSAHPFCQQYRSSTRFHG